MRLNFDVSHPGEAGAGIMPYADRIVIDVESGDPGGEQGEFEAYMRQCIAEWFDGARVESLDVNEALATTPGERNVKT